MLNTRLLSHPINWLVILLMLVIAGMFGHYLLTLFDQSPATKSMVASGLSSEQLSQDQQNNTLDYTKES